MTETLDAARKAATEAASPLARAKAALDAARELGRQAEERGLLPVDAPWVRSQQDYQIAFAQANALVSIADTLNKIEENTRRPGGGYM